MKKNILIKGDTNIMHKYIANQIINRERFLIAKGFFDHSFIYRNTNENIQGHLNQLPIKNKNVLTVASSGDHALLSLLNGAQSVETYDLNHFAKFYQELKISAYQVLSYDDFVSFFYTEKGFTYEIFEKIINLPKEIEDFWQYLFDYNDEYDIIDSQLFSNFEYDYDILKKAHPFLDEEYFLKHKTANNLTFYQCDALNFPRILKKKYDVIMLSSIPNFIEQFRDLKVFKNYLESLEVFLNNGGYIICNYLYNISKTKDSLFKNDELLKQVFHDKMLQKITFPSLNHCCTDAVLVYKKRN